MTKEVVLHIPYKEGSVKVCELGTLPKATCNEMSDPMVHSLLLICLLLLFVCATRGISTGKRKVEVEGNSMPTSFKLEVGFESTTYCFNHEWKSDCKNLIQWFSTGLRGTLGCHEVDLWVPQINVFWHLMVFLMKLTYNNHQGFLKEIFYRAKAWSSG